MNRSGFSLIWLIFYSAFGYAQSHQGPGHSTEAKYLYSRLQTIFPDDKRSFDINFPGPDLIRTWVSQIDTSQNLSKAEENDLLFLKKLHWDTFYKAEENNKKTSIYAGHGHFFTYKNDNVSLTIDPLLYLSFGDDGKNDGTIFRNTRGLKISGSFENKLFFHTALFENQSRFLPHIERRIQKRKAIPGNGFYKRYQSDLFDAISGWDYLNAEAVLTYRPSDIFRVSMGHSNFFLGNGYHSLLLNNYSDNYFFVEFNTSIGRINYKNIFAELAVTGSTIDQPEDELAPKKYLAAHYLTYKPSGSLEISLFEAVVFGRSNQFELQYLNPLILYRVVEQKLDSPDNVLIGFDISYNINQKALLYGQLLIDEMRIGELFSGSGWWGNKIAYQVGAFMPNLFKIDHLDMRMEYNSVRPYTYSHRILSGAEGDVVIASYSHYNQELAHPLGANFRELLTTINYSISSKWRIGSKLIWARTGDSFSENIGNNILEPNNTRTNEYENHIGQGNGKEIFQLEWVVTHSFYHNHYLDFEFLYRNEHAQIEAEGLKTLYFGLSFRANMSRPKLDY